MSFEGVLTSVLQIVFGAFTLHCTIRVIYFDIKRVFGPDLALDFQLFFCWYLAVELDRLIELSKFLLGTKNHCAYSPILSSQFLSMLITKSDLPMLTLPLQSLSQSHFEAEPCPIVFARSLKSLKQD